MMSLHVNPVVRKELIRLEEVEKRGAVVWARSVPGRGSTKHKDMSEQQGSVSGDEIQENTGWRRELIIYGLVGNCNYLAST